ncbi:hypothetical protein [Dapis sp. BLCC M172]|uniref:hypothetical protein n=1 Tax=Dapis sp. BLCC M172 TaxID=2975281 RepID=UPI003CEACDEB
MSFQLTVISYQLSVSWQLHRTLLTSDFPAECCANKLLTSLLVPGIGEEKFRPLNGLYFLASANT